MLKIFYNLKITHKLALSYFIVLVLVCWVGILGLVDIVDIQKNSREVYEKHLLGVTHLTRIAETYPMILSRTRDILLTEDPVKQNEFERDTEALERDLDDLNSQLKKTLHSPTEQDLYEEYIATLDEFTEGRSEIATLAISKNERQTAITLLYGTFTARVTKLKKSIEKLIIHKQDSATIAQKNSDATVEDAYNTLFWFILASVLLTIAIAIFVYYDVSKPIQELTLKANRISTGEMSVEKIFVRRKDEVGQVIKSFNDIIEYLRDILEQSEAIAKGDYSVRLEVRSENDKLSQVINKMNSTLRDQNWLKDGANTLNEELSGHFSLQEIADKAISILGRFLDSGFAVLYLYDDHRRALRLLSSYAYTERERESSYFRIGEGIVGQVALEKKPILLKNISNTSSISDITTGTTSRKPLNTYTFPLLYEKELCGVIEVASLDVFDKLKQLFVEDVAPLIASHLYSAVQNERIQNLLDTAELAKKEAQERAQETSEANEQLKAQQFALQKQAEELQQQAEEMQQQAEELQQTNEELQQQQELMEKQSTELQKRNIDLVELKTSLEGQAEELTRSSKYKSEFLANMSHELRTPLNSIILLSDMLRRNAQGRLDRKDTQKAGIIYQSGNDLLSLINDLLDISKIEAGKMVVNIHHFHTRELKEEMSGLFADLADQKKVDFIIRDEINTELMNDKDKIAQVLKNFLSNAFKFTKKGSVTLSIRPSGRTDLPVIMGVRDTGIGIPKEKQQLIFEAFQQADGSVSREFGGTGLGLSIAREMARLLGGEVHLDSEEGKGSEFYILLPKVNEGKVEIQNKQVDFLIEGKKATSQSMEAAKKHAEKINVSKESSSLYLRQVEIMDDRDNWKKGDKAILIIEDNIDYANSLVEISRSTGFKAVIATHGDQALKYLKRYNPVGILMDLGLPDINGVELLEDIKKKPEYAHIPISIVSARDKTLDLFQKGAVGYLQKPVESDNIRAAVVKLAGISDKKEKRLLVVEDDETHRNLLLEIFARGGITAVGMHTEKEAIKALLTKDYDAVIVDLQLTEGSGWGLCRYIRENRIDIPVIIYTGQDLSLKQTEELNLYAVDIVLKKPDAPNKLLEKAKMFLHKVSEDIGQKAPENAFKTSQSNEIELDKIKKPVEHQKESSNTSVQKNTEKASNNTAQASDWAQETEAQLEAETSELLKGKKILIVDDDIRNVFVITSALENHEAYILEALNGKEALDILEREPVDLILMDIMMPVMDGYETTRNIRRIDRFKNTPIIAVTAKAQREDRQKCLDAGASDYLTKPVDYKMLLRLIKKYLKL
ncbi:MAG: response regulator [Cytophagales bacterium]|nr:MAG: response regulator [Cytophagales bacterium]TAF60241.1 MAG: response regulator [Cytophagales bacterium]